MVLLSYSYSFFSINKLIYKNVDMNLKRSLFLDNKLFVLSKKFLIKHSRIINTNHFNLNLISGSGTQSKREERLGSQKQVLSPSGPARERPSRCRNSTIRRQKLPESNISKSRIAVLPRRFRAQSNVLPPRFESQTGARRF